APDGIAALHVELARIDAADVVRLEGLRVEHGSSLPGLCAEHGLDLVRRRLGRRLGDDGGRPLEACEGVAERVGPERALAVRQVLRLVAVRVLDVREM